LPVQNGLINAVGSDADTEFTLMVGHPAHDISRIFSKLGHLSRDYIEPVRIENGRITLVQAYDNLIFHIFKVINKLGTHLFKNSEPLQVAAINVHTIKLVIFISSGIFQIKQPVVSLPEVTGNITGCFRGDPHR